MRIFKTAKFVDLNEKIKIPDEALKEAIKDWNTLIKDNHPFKGFGGLTNLGGDVYKVEFDLGNGRGRKTGARSIFFCKEGDKAIFVFLFQKNDKANLTPKQLAEAKKLAKFYFDKSSKEFEKMIEKGHLLEVK